MTTATKAPQVGDPVHFEGLPHVIAQVARKGEEYLPRRDGTRTVAADEDFVIFESVAQHRKAGRRARTRALFRTKALLADLRWSDELQAWYLWGRLLGAGRGAVYDRDPASKTYGQKLADGPTIDQRQIVRELRDRGLLPARATRQPGSVPAGGEHENLWAALFSKSLDWNQELANVRRGDGLSENANAAVADYAERYQRPLARGYADPDATDSKGEG